MIEVTDEMKKLVDDELGDIDSGYYHWGEYRDSTIKRIIELHEQTKWVKFDVDDESTYPQRTGHHIAFDGRKVSHKYWDNTGDNTMEDKRIRNNSWFVSGSVNFNKATHWQPLPEFKE